MNLPRYDYLKQQIDSDARENLPCEAGWVGDGNTVRSISDEKLLERAVRGSRDPSAPDGHNHPRWVAVSKCFALGSTFSHQLCRRFGLDPAEMVSRNTRSD